MNKRRSQELGEKHPEEAELYELWGKWGFKERKSRSIRSLGIFIYIRTTRQKRWRALFYNMDVKLEEFSSKNRFSRCFVFGGNCTIHCKILYHYYQEKYLIFGKQCPNPASRGEAQLYVLRDLACVVVGRGGYVHRPSVCMHVSR